MVCAMLANQSVKARSRQHGHELSEHQRLRIHDELPGAGAQSAHHNRFKNQIPNRHQAKSQKKTNQISNLAQFDVQTLGH
jgi:hypothetical protein